MGSSAYTIGVFTKLAFREKFVPNNCRLHNCTVEEYGVVARPRSLPLPMGYGVDNYRIGVSAQIVYR